MSNFYSQDYRPHLHKPSKDILEYCHNIIKDYNVNKDNKVFTKEFFEMLYEFVFRLLKTNFASNVPDDEEKPIVAEWIMDSFNKYFFKNNPKIDNLAAYIRRLAFCRIMAYIQSKYRNIEKNCISFEGLIAHGDVDLNENSVDYVGYNYYTYSPLKVDNSINIRDYVVEMKRELKRLFGEKYYSKYMWLILFSSTNGFFHIEKFFKKESNLNTLLRLYSVKTKDFISKQDYDR